MSPLRVRKEIDGFVADRLLEALWREALWLVADGVATVGEIDDAIRLGAGLRWSFMGTFLAYRMAGGDAGMRGFLEHFGPALEWPWTKLTDVPELTDELVDRITTQSDAQAAGRSLRELERERDDRLVAVLQALRSQDAGAGKVLAAHEARLREAWTPGARVKHWHQAPVFQALSRRCRSGSSIVSTISSACARRSRASVPASAMQRTPAALAEATPASVSSNATTSPATRPGACRARSETAVS